MRTNRDQPTGNSASLPVRSYCAGYPLNVRPKGALLYERRNGQFLLHATRNAKYGVPWGQDRLVPIFLATSAILQRKQTITLAAPPRCWTSSKCSKAVHSTVA